MEEIVEQRSKQAQGSVAILNATHALFFFF